MTRYKITIEYDGTGYAGWQRQPNVPTIQQAIETAILGFSSEQVTLTGAGRTDAGVHARGQVAHFDLEKDRLADEVMGAINAHLAMKDERIAVVSSQAVDQDFDARFSAVKRHYIYKYVCRRAPLTLERKRMWQISHQLDVEAMHAAAQRLVGRHDFTTFRSVQCQAKNPVRTLDRLDVRLSEDAHVIELHATAQAFLHNQIRSFAGTLKKVGEDRWSADDVTKALQAKDRSACGPVAPPHGLYFMQVDYNDNL